MTSRNRSHFCCLCYDGAVQELWQLYDEQGQALVGQGAVDADIFGKGLLHGASHVWIWRRTENGVEVLLQKRASGKPTWPDHYDSSAAGHIDLGEEPIEAAIRETKEEINLDVEASALSLVSVQRSNAVAAAGAIENEFQWVYLLKLVGMQTFELQKAEVDSIDWRSLDKAKNEALNPEARYVPRKGPYYQVVFTAIETASNQDLTKN